MTLARRVWHNTADVDQCGAASVDRRRIEWAGRRDSNDRVVGFELRQITFDNAMDDGMSVVVIVWLVTWWWWLVAVVKQLVQEVDDVMRRRRGGRSHSLPQKRMFNSVSSVCAKAALSNRFLLLFLLLFLDVYELAGHHQIDLRVRLSASVFSSSCQSASEKAGCFFTLSFFVYLSSI